VLRRREGRRFSFLNDDEVHGYQARSALAMFAPPICRRSRWNASRTELISDTIVRRIRRRRRPSANIAPSGASLRHSEPWRAEQLGTEDS
jgi:hypothetical protein